MTNNKNNLIIEKQKLTETVAELKETNWWEKYNKKTSNLSKSAQGLVNRKSGSDYVSGDKEGYGPCRNSLCGCSCSSYTCKCSNASMWIGGDSNGGFLSYSASGRTSEGEIDPTDIGEWALKAAGAKDRGASGQVSGSVFNYRDGGGELKVLGGTASGEVSRKSIKGKLSADLYNVKSDGVQVRVGVALDTGVSVEGGLEVKAAGFGFSVGKQTGISTPFGEVKVDTDDCVVQ